MATLAEVRGEMQTLLGDPDGDWVTPAYADPFINIAYKTQITYLLATCQPFVTAVRFIPGDATNPPPNPVKGIPIGTQDLTPWMTKGQPFAGLMRPLKLEWKLAGQPEEYYTPAIQPATLPNVAPPGNMSDGAMYYEFRAYKLFVTPMAMLVDLRLRGDFKPFPLLKEDDEIIGHPMMETALSYGSAALAGIERVNETYIKEWGDLATATLDDVAADMIRSGQRIPTRLGRQNRMGNWGRL